MRSAVTLLLALALCAGDARCGSERPTDVVAPALSVPRCLHAAIRLDDGRVLIAGGWRGRGLDLASAEVYDPRDGTTRPTGSCVRTQPYPSMCRLGDGRVLLVGYRGLSKEPVVEIFDSKTERWEAAARPAQDHPNWLQLVALQDGRAMIVPNADTRTRGHAGAVRRTPGPDAITGRDL